MKRVFAYVGFSMAITLIALNMFLTKYCIFALVGLVALFAASLALPRYRQAKVVPLSVGAALFACLLFCVNFYNNVLPQKDLTNQKINSSFYVVSNPQYEDGKYKYVAKTVFIDCNGSPQNIKILLNSNHYIEPYIINDGVLRLSYISNDSFHSYGYSGDNVFLSANCESVIAKNKIVSSPNRYLLLFRKAVGDCFDTNISGQEGALSKAMITGDKTGLASTTKKYFTNSGISHIIAISGLHLTIIVGAFVFIFKALKLKEKIANAFLVAIILFYMLFVGLSGSVTRAGIMLIVCLLGKIFNKRSDGVNSLGLAISLMCLNPYAVTDVGALFSVLSVLSMITVAPKIKGRFKVQINDPLNLSFKEKLEIRVVDFVTITIVSSLVSLFTLPVSYLFFDRVSIVSPISNLVAVPLSSVCVSLSLLTYFVSLLKISKLTFVFAFMAKTINSFVIAVAKFFSSSRGAVLTFDYKFGAVIAGCFLLLAIGFFSNKIGVKRAAAFSLCFLVLSTVYISVIDKNNAKVFVTDGGCVVTNYKDKTVVYGIKSKSDYYDVEKCLSIINDDVDVLVVGDEPFYSSQLSKNEFVNTLIANDFDDIILVDSSFNHLEVQNSYNLKLDQNYLLYYSQDEVTFDINGFVVSTIDKNADLYVDTKIAKDKNGAQKIGNGTIVYTIVNKNTFDVRRMSQWQK